MYDVAVIGGGILGSCTALFLARGGMRVALLERAGLCMQASGRNAGTLTLLYARGPLIPLSLKGKAMWADAPSWLGASIDYHAAPGLELAFTDEEAKLLEAEMTIRQRDYGLSIELVGGNRAREIEPGICEKVRLAAYSPADGFAASNLVGGLVRAALVAAGVDVRDHRAVENVAPDGDGFAIRQAGKKLAARRVVLTANTWVKGMLAWFGLDLPIKARINQIVVTERMRPAVNTVLRVVSQISLKQTNNGMFLIGGSAGFPWFDNPDEPQGDLLPENVLAKLRIATYAVPAIAETRIVRSWHGLEGYTPDNLPLIGPVPGVPGAYIMACLRSGFTIGPHGGKTMAEILLGQRPESELFLPEFDPARLAGTKFELTTTQATPTLLRGE